MATAQDISRLEGRVAALEAEVTRLRAKVEGETNSKIPWWEKIAGAFAGDPAFAEAMRLGREWRESFRPEPQKRRKSRRR